MVTQSKWPGERDKLGIQNSTNWPPGNRLLNKIHERLEPRHVSKARLASFIHCSPAATQYIEPLLAEKVTTDSRESVNYEAEYCFAQAWVQVRTAGTSIPQVSCGLVTAIGVPSENKRGR